jgi:hypothetical protein
MAFSLSMPRGTGALVDANPDKIKARIDDNYDLNGKQKGHLRVDPNDSSKIQQRMWDAANGEVWIDLFQPGELLRLTPDPDGDRMVEIGSSTYDESGGPNGNGEITITITGAPSAAGAKGEVDTTESADTLIYHSYFDSRP